MNELEIDQIELVSGGDVVDPPIFTILWPTDPYNPYPTFPNPFG
jgi:hypothetical protein